MYDFWIGDINIAPLLLLFTFAILLPGQLLMCCKIKSVVVRLLPVIILSVLAAGMGIAAAVSTGWEIIFFLVSAVYLVLMLLVCATAWGIWAILKAVKKGTDTISY